MIKTTSESKGEQWFFGKNEYLFDEENVEEVFSIKH